MHSIESDFCPVCGFGLGFPPWSGKSASDEICPSCYIQFGYDDGDLEDGSDRIQVYEEWRRRWIDAGMEWKSKGRRPPDGWNPIEQLRSIGIHL